MDRSVLKSLSREALVMSFRRLYAYKYYEMETGSDIKAEIAAHVAEFKRRRINVKIEVPVTVMVPVESFLNPKAQSLETISL